MRRSAKAQTRRDQLFVSSWSATEGAHPAFVQGDWMEAAAEPVADGDLGRLVRSALAASIDGVPFPDFRKGPAAQRLKLLRLAGVKSETQFTQGMRSVSINWSDADGVLKVTPYRNGGGREGFTEMADHVVTVDDGVDDAALGAAVRQALAVATDAS